MTSGMRSPAAARRGKIASATVAAIVVASCASKAERSSIIARA